MDGFIVDEDGEAGMNRENGGSRSHGHVHAKHRRSKSASDRNSGFPGGVQDSIKKHQNVIHASPLSARAYYRASQSPLYEHPAYINKKSSTNHRASLEKDIEELQSRLQEEKSMRLTLERAMGRVSSTLSPGHRHFAAQTKELVAEIELLEEEVSNREQHVLTLYRSIFEQCVSRPPSEQNSGVASPAHTKHGSRKHPSIISSAFCSSKKFPLRPLQALVSINDSGKRTLKTPNAPFFNGKTDIQFEKTDSNTIKTHEKVSNMAKASVLRTLKDHLYQCPSKLSEEMVRIMAAVYSWLRSAVSVNPEKNRSPLLSRSSTNVVLPRRGIGEDRDWSCKPMVEISWISTDTSQFSRASYAINNYRFLVEQLEKVSVSQMENNAQIAFWINVYNALVMHAYLAYGIPHGSLRRLALFHKAAYNIGGHIISANAIEQSIFCFHTPRIGRWLETILSTALRKKSGEERQLISSKFGLPYSDPLVCFALCTGALSDPALKVYTVSSVKEELEAAKREFLQANVVVKKSRKVFLPKVLERFAKEASISSDDLLMWVTENVDKKLHDSIRKCIDRKSNRKSSQIIEWLPYSSRFRYVFSKDLTESIVGVNFFLNS
ncbi:DUF547 domain-containing protein/Lzipper-MIP1 domain-containing protein [Cephalotus follicularis]|uniref:DUF547 domain-containing protein/Lzipper-MIP1 domain-containing protein n=1 Tax=Cephalotus follicularis TaxID=3775 RepID=A0A1Q3BY08_CEPFO|nr:DUF547 domain-containing protein/Lzipper-MIP1 domain-containing protein [Cephalotus follicularis]